MGRDPNRYLLPVKTSEGGESVFRPTDSYWHVIGERLSRWDGVSPWEKPESPPSLRRYRLVHESESFTDYVVGTPASLKVFEYVKGARITGHTLPRAAVRAEVPIRTNRMRSFVYVSAAAADERGLFTLVVPYATRGPHEVCALSPYRVSSLGLEGAAEVTEEDALQGREAPVVFRLK